MYKIKGVLKDKEHDFDTEVKLSLEDVPEGVGHTFLEEMVTKLGIEVGYVVCNSIVIGVIVGGVLRMED